MHWRLHIQADTTARTLCCFKRSFIRKFFWRRADPHRTRRRRGNDLCRGVGCHSGLCSRQYANLAHYTINLRVMDCGAATESNCVVSAGQCQMGGGKSATHLRHPGSQIELTAMIGMNDVSSEVFTRADVDTITSYAAAHGMAGLHFWSLNRDTPCPGASSSASSICNSVSGSTALHVPNVSCVTSGDKLPERTIDSLTAKVILARRSSVAMTIASHINHLRSTE